MIRRAVFLCGSCGSTGFPPAPPPTRTADYKTGRSHRSSIELRVQPATRAPDLLIPRPHFHTSISKLVSHPSPPPTRKMRFATLALLGLCLAAVVLAKAQEKTGGESAGRFTSPTNRHRGECRASVG